MLPWVIILSIVLGFLSSTQAAVLPATTVHVNTVPGPTCTLVDGGADGGTFCNRWNGSGTLTNTNWVTTVTPWLSTHSTLPPDSGPSTTATETGDGSASSSATEPKPAPSGTTCGEVGVFQIDFDDLPVAGIPSDAPEGPPIFNPADHFYWGTSWTYGPPPTEPYRPQSGDRLGHSVGDANSTITGSPQAGEVPSKGFGAGPRNWNDIYWFSLISAYVQCDFSTIGDDHQQCDFTATAYQYNAQLKEDRVVATQHWAQDRCDSLACSLNQIRFDEPFSNLSVVSFYGVVGGKIVDFYADSIRLEWYNNSCEAGLARISSRK